MVERKKKPKFLRKDWHKKSKLGKGRKKIRKWVKPRGRHSKLREKRKGHGKSVSIGYSQAKEIRGKIQNLIPRMVSNVSELDKVTKNEIAIFTSVGLKKKIEMAKKSKEKGIKVNFNIDKFLEGAQKKVEQRKLKRKGKEQAREEKMKKEKETKKEEKEEKTESKEEKDKETEEKKEKKEKEEKKALMKPVEKEKHREMVQKKQIIQRKTFEGSK